MCMTQYSHICSQSNLHQADCLLSVNSEIVLTANEINVFWLQNNVQVRINDLVANSVFEFGKDLYVHLMDILFVVFFLNITCFRLKNQLELRMTWLECISLA